jgi:hypothetical protein
LIVVGELEVVLDRAGDGVRKDGEGNRAVLRLRGPLDEVRVGADPGAVHPELDRRAGAQVVQRAVARQERHLFERARGARLKEERQRGEEREESGAPHQALRLISPMRLI